jgi:hypothetical protein
MAAGKRWVSVGAGATMAAALVLLAVHLAGESGVGKPDAQSIARQIVGKKLVAPTQARWEKVEALGGSPGRQLFHVVVHSPNALGVMLRNSFLVAFSWTDGEENFTAGENAVQECSDPPTAGEREVMQALNGWP